MTYVGFAALGAIANIRYKARRAFQDGLVWLQEYADFIHRDKRIGVCV